MRIHVAFGAFLIGAVLAGFLAVSVPAQASADVNMYGYTSGGSFTPLENGGSMPVGATVEVHVWADLYACDPIRVYWGDGTFDFMNFGGSFSETFTHTYSAEGTYTIYARDCANTGGNTATITVGGMGGNLFDPSSAMFVPTFLGLIFGLIALAMALGTPRAATAAAAAAGPATPGLWRPTKHLEPGIPASMATHVVSYRDIPVGAPKQPDPRIPMRPGEPTDVFADPHCVCGGKLGYVAGGWFCLNPACPLREPKDDPFPRFIHGL